tara:strand:+ start:292 stop:1167 length:876 start_codon:yes stop_codon:yes gene_type:complete
VGCDVVANMFVEGFPSTVKGFIKQYDIPEDAEYVKCHLDIISDSFAFVIRHDSWDIVPTGEVPPDVDRLPNDNWIPQEAFDVVRKDIEEAIVTATDNAILGVVNSDGTVQVSGHTVLKAPEPMYINGACTPNSVDEDIVPSKTIQGLDGWINIVGEDYPEPKEPRYKMFHISGSKISSEDLNDIFFNSNSLAKAKFNIPHGSECIAYYSSITADLYHILFTHESFEVWYGYGDMMKGIVEGVFPLAGTIVDTYKTSNHPSSKEIPTAKFMPPVSNDVLDDFLDKYGKDSDE